ncbi:MAG: peptidoglycan-binding protein [Lachnospiraceae bacterium]|nr:peptidoglycan-binding protein [Lachnospiraceae bacterium]
MSDLKAAQAMPDTGYFRAAITSKGNNRPVTGATIQITDINNPNAIIDEITTDQNGQSDTISLPAPPLEYSLQPEANQPYAVYNIRITADGFEPVDISGAEILSGQTALQNVTLLPLDQTEPDSEELFVIPPHTLYGEYPPKIPEDEIKTVSQTGEIVLSRVVIPEYVIVHDGPPNDASAKDYYVRYKDYIKNVASSEIYATWPEATIYANILAIQSITLNRVYTEWYRNQGKDFTITSSTAYDQKWIPGRNIYDSISRAVDTIFSNYLTRPNIRQPLFTQYCDGQRVSCPRWMRQWESKSLGENGYSAIEILRYFYGSSIYINTSEEISGIPSSWPGTNLTIGSSGNKVRQMQEQLNVIANAYPLIPKITADGIYGENTANTVRIFQSVFDLPQTGVTDYSTWYKISEVYVGVSRIAELS